ncbi:Zgc:194878, partial [Caligus rogercresseyi]
MPSMGSYKDPLGMRGAEILAIPMDEMVKYFNKALIEGKLPQELITGRTTLIPKKEDPQLAGDYRPITVLPHITKVLHIVLANRLKKARINSCQKGFREVNGCSENNMVLRNLIGTATDGQRNFPLAFAFIDLAKAFDSVSHESLLLAARRVGVPPLNLNHHYENAKTKIGDRDAIFKLGILQGDPLSGHLFNFVLDWVLDITYNTTPIGTRNPVRIGATHVEALLFADDAVLVSKCQQRCQRAAAAGERLSRVIRKGGVSCKPTEVRIHSDPDGGESPL